MLEEDTTQENEELEDPIKTILTYLQNGECKNRALLMVQGIENALLADNFNLDNETQIALNHIFASVYVWNNQYTNAQRLHNSFLANEQWCLSNKPTIESYLLIVLVQKNKNFIQTLWENQLINTNFNHLYKAYLGFVNPNSEEHYNIDLLPYYQKLKIAQKLYCEQ